MLTEVTRGLEEIVSKEYVLTSLFERIKNTVDIFPYEICEWSYGVAIYKDLISLARGVPRMYVEKRPPPLFMEFKEEKAATLGFGLNRCDEGRTKNGEKDAGRGFCRVHL